MRIKLWLTLLLALTLTAGAADWTADKGTWSHGQDMSVTVPEGLTAKEDENGVLAVQHASGAMYVSLIWAANETEAGQVISAMVGQVKKDIPDVKLSEPRGGEMPNGNLQLQDGPGTINGAVFDVTVGLIKKDKKHLCFFALMSKADLARWSPLMDALMTSVKFK